MRIRFEHCVVCHFRLPYCVRRDRRFCSGRCQVWAYRNPGQTRPDPRRATHVYRETARLVRELADTRAKLKALMEQQEDEPRQLRALAAREAAALAALKRATEREALARDDLADALVRERAFENDLQKVRNEGKELASQLRAADLATGRAERAREELAEQLEELQDEAALAAEKLGEATHRAAAAEARAEALAARLREEQARVRAQPTRLAPPAPPAPTPPAPSKALEKARTELRAAKERIGELTAELKQARTAATKAVARPVQAAPPPAVPVPVDARRRGKAPLAEHDPLVQENSQLRAELVQARQAGAEALAQVRELQRRTAVVQAPQPPPQQAPPPARWRVPETEEDPDLRRRVEAALHTGYEPAQDRLVKSLVSLYRTEHELALRQEERGLAVTAQRIRPGTDLLMVAFCEAMQLRSDFPRTLSPSQYRQHINRANWPFHLDSRAELELWNATIHRRALLEEAMGK